MDKYRNGRWHIKIDEGATAFASKLSVNSQTADLLKDAYSEIISNNKSYY